MCNYGYFELQGHMFHIKKYLRGGRQQKQEELQSYSLQNENHNHKVRQNEKAEDYAADEGTR